MAGTIKEARLSGADRALRVFARGMVAVVQRPVVHGPKPVLDGPAIFIGRHVGLMDPVILMVQYYHQLLHPLVALDYYEKNAFTRAFYTHAQCIPVDRKNHSQQWLEDSIAALRRGESIIIFPEGRRNKEGDDLLPFHTGAVRLAALSGAQVIPVYNAFWHFPKPYHLAIGEPFHVEGVPEGGMDLYVRIPEYARNFSLTVADKGAGQAGEDDGKGYRKIHLDADTELEAAFDMPARYVFANSNVRADIGKTAVMRGPLVYCLEECDNGARLQEITADIQAPLTVEDSDLFGGCKIVRGSGTRLVRSSDETDTDSPLYSETPPEKKAVSFTAVPYPYWNNRGAGEMLVWIGASIR